MIEWPRPGRGLLVASLDLICQGEQVDDWETRFKSKELTERGENAPFQGRTYRYVLSPLCVDGASKIGNAAELLETCSTGRPIRDPHIQFGDGVLPLTF